MAKQPNTYLRAYPHSLASTNAGKVAQVLDLFTAYTALAGVLRDHQLTLLYVTGRLDKNAKVPAALAASMPLSARYQQVCQYQVVAMLDSWLALRQDDFRRLVLRSSLEGALRAELLTINKDQAWFQRVTAPADASPQKALRAEALRLARALMRHLRLVHRLPVTKNINLALDAKVACLAPAEQASEFPYWLKLATLNAGKPIYLPLAGNTNAAQAGGKRKAFVQLNLSAETGLSAVMIQEFERKAYTPKTDVLALDTGLVALFATQHGDLLGTSVFAQLQALDKLVTNCAASRQQRGLRVRSLRYDGSGACWRARWAAS